MRARGEIPPWFATGLSVAMFMVLWGLGAHYLGSDELPGPTLVWAEVVNNYKSGLLLKDTGITLWRVFASFVIAISIGIALGILLGSHRRTDQLFDPWLIFFLNVPALLVIILAYIWMGLTEMAAITAVAVNKIPNVVVTIREGVRALRRDLQETAEVFRFGYLKTLFNVTLPELGPYIAASMRSGIALIWKIVLVVELLGRSDGVGFQLSENFQLFDIAGIMSWGLVFIVIMQVVEFFALRPLENYLNRWRK